MTDFFILAVAVFAAVVLVRMLTSHWVAVEEDVDEPQIR